MASGWTHRPQAPPSVGFSSGFGRIFLAGGNRHLRSDLHRRIFTGRIFTEAPHRAPARGRNTPREGRRASGGRNRAKSDTSRRSHHPRSAPDSSSVTATHRVAALPPELNLGLDPSCTAPCSPARARACRTRSPRAACRCRRAPQRVVLRAVWILADLSWILMILQHRVAALPPAVWMPWIPSG